MSKQIFFNIIIYRVIFFMLSIKSLSMREEPMGKKDKFKKYDEDYDIDLKNCKLLGEGNNGWVYLMPDGKVIKICKEIETCRKEYIILKQVEGSHHFPRAFFQCGNYMIRDYVGGESLQEHVKRKGLSKRLALNLIGLIDEFKEYGFTKLDVRLRDLYVQGKEDIMVIDPRASFSRRVSFPRHLMKGLDKLGALNKFLQVLREKKPELSDEWIEKYKVYIANR